MAGRTTQTIHLAYGRDAAVDLAIDEHRVRALMVGPPAAVDILARLHAALDQPLDFPPLEQAVIPDDKIVLALDRGVPDAPLIISAVWERLTERGVAADRVTILQPADGTQDEPADPRSSLPAKIRGEMHWEIHQATPESEGGYHYLATTAAGERVYLSGTLLDADVVVPIGRIGFDPLLGFRGTNSVLYPGLSTAEAVKRAQGQGHTELGSNDDRPLRQMVDEVGWLVGTTFTVQVVPAAGGGASDVLAGSVDSVFRKCRELLAERWTVSLPERAETVVVAVDADAGGHGWSQVAAALSVARRLVVHDGRIIVLSQLDETAGEGIELVRRAEEPRDAFRPLRQSSPADLLPATQFAQAVDWARVYLLSRLDSDLVEDLFCVPIESEAEVVRLLASGDESCVFVGSAQHADVRIG